MTVKEYFEDYPDDDGERTMVWIKGPQREKVGVSNVREIFSKRPWVTGEMEETENNSPADQRGIDMYVPIKEELLEIVGIKSTKKGIPVQIKSSYKEVRQFLKDKKMAGYSRLTMKDRNYIITLNGTDSKYLILADLVGQMMVLALNKGLVKTEDEFLILLQEWYGDVEAVIAWAEQKEVILEHVWYKDLFDV